MKNKKELLILIGKNIREIRIKKGISQEELAFRASINRTYMGDIERGEHSVSAANLFQIAKVLRVEVGDLFPSIK